MLRGPPAADCRQPAVNFLTQTVNSYAVLVIGNRPDYNAIMLESKSADEILFDVETPLGFRVRTTIGCWELIARIKHPVVRGRQEDIQETLRRPARCEQACQMRRSIYSIALMEPSAGCVR